MPDYSGLYWIHGLWPGKLAIAARPRGADWLCDDLRLWCKAGVHAIVSLLTAAEERELELERERKAANDLGLTFLSCPVEDRGVPDSVAPFMQIVEETLAHLESGKVVAAHCRQGIGRSGLFAAAVLRRSGIALDLALEIISAARGVPVPETEEQRLWLQHFGR